MYMMYLFLTLKMNIAAPMQCRTGAAMTVTPLGSLSLVLNGKGRIPVILGNRIESSFADSGVVMMVPCVSCLHREPKFLM